MFFVGEGQGRARKTMLQFISYGYDFYGFFDIPTLPFGHTLSLSRIHQLTVTSRYRSNIGAKNTLNEVATGSTA